MFRIVQLQDGNYRVTVEVQGEDYNLRYEWTFTETETEAPEKPGGLLIEVNDAR